MPYKAYLDKQKRQTIEARAVSITQETHTFYCKTPGCNAHMTIVNCADPERAYFRRRSSGPKHINVFCSADGKFDPTKYIEKDFDFSKAAEKILKSTNTLELIGRGTSAIKGGGGKKPISTVLQIYYMCRRFDYYNGIDTSNILADERNFTKYENGIEGYKIVQCTQYHKVKDEKSFIMNFPSYPFPAKYRYIKIYFTNEEAFWTFYNKVKESNHKELIIILGDWRKKDNSTEYIAECEINKNNQIHFLKSDF